MAELKNKLAVTSEERKRMYKYWERVSALSRAFEHSTSDNKVLNIQRKVMSNVRENLLDLRPVLFCFNICC